MDDYLERLRGNIFKIHLLYAAWGALTFVPIIVLYWQDNGLTLQEGFLLQAIFSACILLLEIPSGYLSDRWGRKKTLILGSAAATMGVVVYSLGTSFWGFLFAEILLAIAFSCNSGTLEAITYDTLLELKKEDSYRPMIGKQLFSRFSTEAVASLIGGALALISLRTAVSASILPLALGFLVSLTLEEPRRQKLQESRHLYAMFKICQQNIIHNVALRGIIIIYALVSSSTLLLFWFTQPYQADVGLPLALFGITHALIVISGAFASRSTHWLTERIDDRLMLSLIAILVMGCYFSLGFIFSLWGIAIFFVARICWGVLTPLTSDIINRMTTSDVRATVVSMRQFGARAVFVVSAPFFGHMADLYTINDALLWASIIIGTLLLFTFLLMRPVWGRIPQ